MPKFSEKSLAVLETCDIRLVRLAMRVVEKYDCSVLTGHRGRVDQENLYRQGLSRLKYALSKHNSKPALAVDLAPYNKDRDPHIDWNDAIQWYHFAGYVKGVADSMKTPVRCGADWDSDNDLRDQTFMDLGHFELLEV